MNLEFCVLIYLLEKKKYRSAQYYNYVEMSYFFFGVCGLSSLVKFFVKTSVFLAFSNLKKLLNIKT